MQSREINIGQTHLEDDSRLLQQIRPHVGPDDVEVLVEVDLDVLPEARRVVVPRRLGVADRLHDWRGGNDLSEVFKDEKQRSEV